MTISAKIIADSIAPNGIRITTYELVYPRFIHAEFMTHRLFSRNAASSRAIPVSRAIELIREDTAMPIHWGKNQPGMSAKEECMAWVPMDQHDVDHNAGIDRRIAWNVARDNAIKMAEAFDRGGYHKQIVNRMLEPFSHIKVVVTATEYNNFFYLRRHPDAQPEIQKLAEEMWQAREESNPVELRVGDWHVPYYRDGFWRKDQDSKWDQDEEWGTDLQTALMVSSSCCAQVSYRRLDDSLEKAEAIYKRLIESKPCHASPFEHQATPIAYGEDEEEVELPQGVTHLTVVSGKHTLNGMPLDAWSGNLRGWIQHRHLIPENTVYG
jgi:hypothetical protein